MKSKLIRGFSAFAIAGLLIGCPSGDDHDHDEDAGTTPVADAGTTPVEDAGSTTPEAPTTYEFAHMGGGEGSSVSNTGQIHRQALISAMKAWMGGLTDEANAGNANRQDVLDAFNFYYEYDPAVGAEIAHGLEFRLPALQTNWGDISSKSLKGKLAGNDPKTDHRCWDPQSPKANENPNCAAGESHFNGWTGASSPAALINVWAEMLAGYAQVRSTGGDLPVNPITNEPVEKVFLNDQGHDLQQLFQKFLMGAIGFSQGTDDYLGSDVDGKGLKASNAVDSEKGYSPLAHAWDEAFGYFGAARNFNDYTDDEIASKGGREDWKGHHDTNGDGKIDLKTEVNWGHSINAAKRDRGSQDSAKTDYTKEAMDHFIAGRHLIQNAGETLTADEMTTLEGHRDTIVAAWEKAIAATGVHYINDCLADLAADTLPYADYAKHWGELKGFTLGLQFNPASPVTVENFIAFHNLLGEAPKLPGQDGFDTYATDLRAARDILAAAYGFDSANVEGW